MNTGEIVAIKIIDNFSLKNEVERSLIFQEIQALRVAKSSNILRLLDAFQTDQNTFIITEFCDQGDLDK